MSRLKPSPEGGPEDQSLTMSEQARYSQLMLKIDAYLNKGGTSPTEADFAEWKGLLTKKVDIKKHSVSELGALEQSLLMPLERS